MPDIGVPELLIIAVIVLLLFGPAKAADLGGALGKSIREFRKASSEDADSAPTVSAASIAPAAGASAAQAPGGATPAATATATATAKFCTACGAAVAAGQRFCTSCGTQRVA